MIRPILLTSLLFIASACLAQTQPQTVEQVFDRSVSGPERATLALAEAMPEDRYSFVPTQGEFKGVRSFAQLAKHIAVSNYVDGSALLGEKIPVETGTHDNGPDSVSTKAQVIKFLKESFIYLHKAVATVHEKNLMELVDYRGGIRIARLQIVTAAISHPWDIYGQMIEYARMNGIDPQAK